MSWDYKWPGLVSTNDRFELEEKTSPGGSFQRIASVHRNGNTYEHIEYPLDKDTGEYWYRVRAKDTSPGLWYSPYSNVVSVAVNTNPGQTITRVINESSHWMLSLELDGVGLFDPGMGLASGQSMDLNVTPGQHHFKAITGQPGVPLYQWADPYTQASGQIFTISIPDPTIAEILTNFGNAGHWSGIYIDTNGIPHSREYFFRLNGTWVRTVDGGNSSEGWCETTVYGGVTFLVSFEVHDADGTYRGIYTEGFDYFELGDGPGGAAVRYDRAP